MSWMRSIRSEMWSLPAEDAHFLLDVASCLVVAWRLLFHRGITASLREPILVVGTAPMLVESALRRALP
jgi:hypothetical protein